MPNTTRWTYCYEGEEVTEIKLGAKGWVLWMPNTGTRKGMWHYYWNAQEDEHTFLIEFSASGRGRWKKHVFTGKDDNILTLQGDHVLYDAVNLWHETSLRHNNGAAQVQMNLVESRPMLTTSYQPAHQCS